MKSVQHATDLLRERETALFIFTDGRSFERRSDDSSSGELYEARIGDFHQRITDGRYRIELREIRVAGSARVNWPSFVSASQNPIRYVTRS